jgi:LPXTG-motif cell wall-anchored protein
MKKLLVCLLTALMVISLLPATAFAGTAYNSNDYGKLRAFLEQESADAGVKNGTQLYGAGYDPDDPATWTSGITWNSDPEKRVTYIFIDGSMGNGKLAGAANFSDCAALNSVEIYNQQFTSANVSGCTALAHLNLYNCLLTSLDVSGLTALYDISCTSNQITSLNVSGCTQLGTLGCGDNQLTSLDVSTLTNLQRLYCDSNKLTALSLGSRLNFYTLACDKNQITSLDVSGLPNLNTLSCIDNQLTALDLIQNSYLLALYCDNNLLTSLDCTNAYLFSLRALGNPLKSLKARFNNEPMFISPLASTKDGGEKLGLRKITDPYTVELTANGNGTVGLCNNISIPILPPAGTNILGDINPIDPNGPPRTFYAQATAGTGALFIDWTSGGSQFATTAKTDLTVPTSYALTANFTTLGLAGTGSIFTGGRTTITPNLPGGTWDYPKNLLSGQASGSGMIFTGIAPGTAVVTYTLGGVVASYSITVTRSGLPDTGQDSTLILLLAGAAAVLLAAGITLVLIRKRKAQQEKAR